jgi:hypothetical protein
VASVASSLITSALPSKEPEGLKAPIEPRIGDPVKPAESTTAPVKNKAKTESSAPQAEVSSPQDQGEQPVSRPAPVPQPSAEVPIPQPPVRGPGNLGYEQPSPPPDVRGPGNLGYEQPIPPPSFRTGPGNL